MPLLSYLLSSVSCSVARCLSVVLPRVNVTSTSVFLNSLVVDLVAFPIYVNFAYNILFLASFSVFLSLLTLFNVETSYLLLTKFGLSCFFLFVALQGLVNVFILL